MASFLAINGAIDALRSWLELRISEELADAVTNPSVVRLGLSELANPPAAHAVGIYLHRVTVDREGKNRYLEPRERGRPPQPELPVNLHVLLVAWTNTTINEAPLIGWAMQEIGASREFDPGHFGADPAWGQRDRVRISPDEISTENLLRIWDTLPGDYRLSVPYVLRTIRLEPGEERTAGPPVRTVVLPVEVD